MASTASNATALDAARAHVADAVRVWLGVHAADATPLPELPEHLTRLLLRLEEYERPRRDAWGCWDYEYSENAERLDVSEVDEWVASRRAELAETTRVEPLWPEGSRFAVCFTHDVDLVSETATPRQVARFARAGFAGSGVLRAARPAVRVVRSLRNGVARVPAATALEHCATLEKRYDATASYLFTVPPPIGRSRYDCVYAPHDLCRFRGATRSVADVMRTLADEGFDVGLHGSYEGAFRPHALAAEREILRRATGLEITSTRQHFLHWDVRSTPRLQEEAGLRVDSSLGFNRNVGFRAGTSFPFRHFDVGAGRALDLVQVPLVIQDGALLGPIGVGRGLSHALGVVDELLDGVAAVGGVASFLFHPDKLGRPDWLQLYEHALGAAAERGAWFASLRDLGDWWRRREVLTLRD